MAEVNGTGNGPFSETVGRLGLFLRQEQQLLLAILTYAVAVGLFSLIIPLTVQELVNTFAFAIQPIMVVTLVSIMAGILVFVGLFRVLQFYATDMLERRVFVRVTLALAQELPRFKEENFRTDHASRFFEAVLMQRALSSLLVDLTNVLVGGLIGMTLLALYHPYFLVFDLFLIGSVVVIGVLGKDGLQTTLYMSEAKYATFHWIQEVADNLLHVKTTNSSNLILQKADALAKAYVMARQSRFAVLLRQYVGSLSLQVVLHTGLLGTAGWLLSRGELTLGQLVAAEVIVATLLLNLDSVVKRMYVIFYFLTALTELDHLFSLPKDRVPVATALHIPRGEPEGVRVSLSHVTSAVSARSFTKEFDLEIHAREKVALVCDTESERHQLSRLVAGLDLPRTGVVRYNDVDLRNVDLEEINSLRGVVFAWDMSLFDGTIADNILVGRPGITTEDLLWALQFVQLEKEIDALPRGLDTPVSFGGKDLTPSQKIRLLLARALVKRPPLLVLDGALHEIQARVRNDILHQLCAHDAPGTVCIVTTDPTIKEYVQTCVSLV